MKLQVGCYPWDSSILVSLNTYITILQLGFLRLCKRYVFMFQAKTPEKPQGWPDFDNAASYQQAADWPAGAIRMQGFSDFNYGCVNVTDSVVCTMDSQWIAKCMESLWRSDPLVVEARKRVSPFLISDIFNAPPVSSSETAMREAISQFPRGVVVPIHCPDVGATVATSAVGAVGTVRGVADTGVEVGLSPAALWAATRNW